MQVKTSELIGQSLDWAVAKCEGSRVNAYGDVVEQAAPYSTEWSQGGPIIELEGINIRKVGSTAWQASYAVMQMRFDKSAYSYHGHTGTTPLIAVMRCYVASKLGDTVEIPNELC